MTQHTHAANPPALARRRPGLQPVPAQQDLIIPKPGTVTLGQVTVSGVQAQEAAEHQARVELIQRLGLPTGPDDLMDQFADHLAETTGMLYGFVNLFLGVQTFVGLHNPSPDSGHLILGRSMSRDHGWCPAVVKRKKALPLPDVHASPRFSGNFVVDAVGIRSYFGAPLIHAETGITLGTVCTIDPEARPRSDARRLLEVVKDGGNEVLHALTSGTAAR
ncbi:GAF domain-containing protein [Streptomyces sp. TRM68367]|uniref:GAF domain-containing protein n=1 Tax=Streptomyces sp. TRM68367 TaxID=2758415 RepID=UPI00165C4AB6|nr:GAF domain-containing protein [Streptomyces sp. TRM68367]MBC9724972.1 GAF domain-containing protein [Streptomyces sp. TRM68367]